MLLHYGAVGAVTNCYWLVLCRSVTRYWYSPSLRSCWRTMGSTFSPSTIPPCLAVRRCCEWHRLLTTQRIWWNTSLRRSSTYGMSLASSWSSLRVNRATWCSRSVFGARMRHLSATETIARDLLWPWLDSRLNGKGGWGRRMECFGRSTSVLLIHVVSSL